MISTGGADHAVFQWKFLPDGSNEPDPQSGEPYSSDYIPVMIPSIFTLQIDLSDIKEWVSDISIN